MTIDLQDMLKRWAVWRIEMQALLDAQSGSVLYDDVIPGLGTRINLTPVERLTGRVQRYVEQHPGELWVEREVSRMPEDMRKVMIVRYSDPDRMMGCAAIGGLVGMGQRRVSELLGAAHGWLMRAL